MSRRLMGGLMAVMLLSPAAAADKPPCEPGAECALSMAREMTMANAQRAQDSIALQHWIRVTDWLEEVDPRPDPAAAKMRFNVLQRQIDRIKDSKGRPLSEQWLASAMINAGLPADAEKIAKSLPTGNRDVVYRNLATRLANEGQWREAVRILELLSDAEKDSPFTYQAVMGILAAGGDPQVIRQSAALMKKPPDYWLPVGLAITELAAGREDAAIQSAMAHKESGWRVGILGALSDHYRDQKREKDSLRLLGKKLDAAREDAPKEYLDEEYKWYFRRLVQAGEFSTAIQAWPNLPQKDRNPWGELTSMLGDLRKAEDISAAAKLLPQLDGLDREYAERALAWSRVFAGLAEPAAALKGIGKPKAAGRHLIEWLGSEDYSAADRGRARALLVASQALVAENHNPEPAFLMFESSALVRAQLKLGLLEEARTSIGALKDTRLKAESMLQLSVAHSQLGQSDLARAARTEGLALLAQCSEPREPDLHAQVLLRAGMIDEAEAALRLLMQPDPLPPAFSRVAKPLLEKRLERGEIAPAFRLAADWSRLHGNPEAIGTFYALLEKKRTPPPDFGGLLQRMRSRDDP
jgi:hypothetical protein